MRQFLIIQVLLFLINPSLLLSQSVVTIPNPRLELDENKIIISYDILNSEPTDLFLIWIEVTDADGNNIKAVTLSGDLGEEIKGGVNKKITWDLEQDKIVLDEEIFIEVKAEKKTPPVVEQKTIPVETTPATEVKTLSKGNMFFSSLVLPGLGQSRIHRGKPYWLLGLASYGCLGGSFYLNKVGASTYNDYKSSVDINEGNELFDKAVKQDKISEYLVYTAAGIWTINLIWILASPGDIYDSSTQLKQKNFNIEPSYDPYLKSTGLTLTYRF